MIVNILLRYYEHRCPRLNVHEYIERWRLLYEIARFDFPEVPGRDRTTEATRSRHTPVNKHNRVHCPVESRCTFRSWLTIGRTTTMQARELHNILTSTSVHNMYLSAPTRGRGQQKGCFWWAHGFGPLHIYRDQEWCSAHKQ